jgi:hypothetical protein
MDYKIHINDTPEKEDYLVVIIIDDKHKTESAFALSKTEKNSTQIRLIKSAIAKVKFLNETKPVTKEAKKKEILKKFAVKKTAAKKSAKKVVKKKK